MRGSHDGNAEHLREEKREDEAEPCGPENLHAGLGGGLVDGVVCGVRSPSGGETIHNGAIGEHRAELSLADAHWDFLKVATVGEHADDDQEDDESGDPGPEFIGVYNLVTEEGDKERADGNDNDACSTIDVWIHGVDELGTDDAVHTGPADAGKHVEHGDQLHSPPAEPEARQHHLAETKFGTKGREEADR